MDREAGLAGSRPTLPFVRGLGLQGTFRNHSHPPRGPACQLRWAVPVVGCVLGSVWMPRSPSLWTYCRVPEDRSLSSGPWRREGLAPCVRMTWNLASDGSRWPSPQGVSGPRAWRRVMGQAQQGLECGEGPQGEGASGRGPRQKGSPGGGRLGTRLCFLTPSCRSGRRWRPN